MKCVEVRDGARSLCYADADEDGNKRRPRSLVRLMSRCCCPRKRPHANGRGLAELMFIHTSGTGFPMGQGQGLGWREEPGPDVPGSAAGFALTPGAQVTSISHHSM